MPNPRLLITAVVVEGRTQAEVARSYGVSQSWLSELVARYRAEGEAAFLARSRRPVTSPTATPPGPGSLTPPHHRIREDIVDHDGKLTLRRAGRLHHIGIGRDHAHTPVLMLIDDLHIGVIDKTTGELIRELVLDSTRDYQPTGKDRYAKWRTQGFDSS